MKKILFYKRVVIILLMANVMSCHYLDIVPKDTATVEDAFTRPAEALNFLHSLYSFMPKINDHLTSPQIWGTDEVVIPWTWYDVYRLTTQPNNTSQPFFDYWGNPGGHAFNYFEGIRQAYTFLDNIDKTPGFTTEELNSMKGEATFIVGFMHFCLIRQYGPTIIVKGVVPLDASGSDLYPYRASYDESVDFVVSKYDEAFNLLRDDQSKTDLGRITRAIAKAAKARILLYAASPLFNGNPDYAGFVDGNGKELISTSYDNEKWDNAIKAIEESIDEANAMGVSLFYEYPDVESNIRYSMVEPWNNELIWGYKQEWYWGWQRHCAPRVIEGGAVTAAGGTGPSLRHIEGYYTENGLPIDEDPAYDYDNRFTVAPGDSTAKLHRNREPRFYANIAFDRGTYKINDDEQNMYFRLHEKDGYDGVDRSNYTRTGYLIQKGVHPETQFSSTENTFIEYPWPKVRLVELYLNMAEALNEYGYGTTDKFGNDAIYYLDLVRARAGIPDVMTAWASSNSPDKPNSQDGLRDIIHRERAIELAFEGHRIWDVRRWKKGIEFSTPVYGLNIEASSAASFYEPTLVEERYFDDKSSYLWPISLAELQKNTNLVQNPGY
ncbi:MAG: RagB/SusD family nutrient uptake outer membrane protein [Bacteroidota bacterium]